MAVLGPTLSGSSHQAHYFFIILFSLLIIYFGHCIITTWLLVEVTNGKRRCEETWERVPTPIVPVCPLRNLINFILAQTNRATDIP